MATFHEGERVLAPWEPEFLYPATVCFVGKRGVMVQYDDGDEGLVPEQEVRPIRIEIGATVQARRNRNVEAVRVGRGDRLSRRERPRPLREGRPGR